MVTYRGKRMNIYEVECWHSGDEDEGHKYVVKAPTLYHANDMFLLRLMRDKVNVDSITWLRIQTGVDFPPTADYGWIE